MPDKQPASRRIQAVDRAAMLLRAVAEAPSAPTVAELADAVGLNRSTAWRLLLTLEHHHLIDRDPDSGRFVVGYEVARLALRAGNEGLARHLRPTLRALAEETAMTAVLAAPTATEPIAIDQVDPPGRPETKMVGWSMPLHASAAGKAWLAFLDEPARDELLRQPLPRFTDATVTDPGQLLRELATIRESGVAMTREEWDPGWTGAASPILVDGSIVAVLCVMATTPRFDSEGTTRAVERVRAAAAAAAANL